MSCAPFCKVLRNFSAIAKRSPVVVFLGGAGGAFLANRPARPPPLPFFSFFGAGGGEKMGKDYDVELLGALALFGLWQSRGGGKVSSGVANSALVLGLIVMAIVARTAHQGGEIHHPEIRPGFTAPTE